MRAESQTLEEIRTTVRSFAGAIAATYEGGDFARLARHCDPMLTGFGTAYHEVIHSLEELRQLFPSSADEAMQGCRISVEDEEIFCIGETAWVLGTASSRIKTNEGWMEAPTMRMTMVLRRAEAQWKVVNMHWSLPDSTPEDAYWDIGSLRDYSRELEQKVEQRTAELKEKNAELESALAQLNAAQKQLVQQEKMASLGRLTAGIAHEIKNPLNFINNFAGLAEELADEMEEAVQNGDYDATTELTKDLKQNARKIVEHGRRADSIVRSMLEHSRGREGERRDIDLNELVDEYADLAYHGMRAQIADFNATIEKQLSAEVGTVFVSSQEIGRVVLNLLNNAFHAVYERSASTGGDYAPTVRITTAADGPDVLIRIEDNGPGIPADLLDKIFEPFFTTKAPGVGTGLGLSMSYDIITSGHGGTMHVHDAEHGGAVFDIRIPRTTKR